MLIVSCSNSYRVVVSTTGLFFKHFQMKKLLKTIIEIIFCFFLLIFVEIYYLFHPKQNELLKDISELDDIFP